jgi:hypothetical protein
MAADSLVLNDVLQHETVLIDAEEQQTAVLRRYWQVFSLTGVGDVRFIDVALAFDTTFGPLYLPLLYNNAEYYGTRIRRAFPIDTVAWANVGLGRANGTAGAVALPTQTAGLVRFSSGSIGKKGQGRQYLPFPAQDSNQTTGIPNGAYVTAAQTLADALATDQVVSGSGSRVATLDPILWDLVAHTPTPILAGASQNAWATQKRRGNYGRTNKPPF